MITQNKELLVGEMIRDKKIIPDRKRNKDTLIPQDILTIMLEVVTGNLLGDGSIITDAKLSAPKSYSMQLTSSYREYIDDLYNIYSPWTTAKIYDKNIKRFNKYGKKISSKLGLHN